MKADNQKTISIKLKPEIKEKLLHLSKIKDRTPHWIMNKAITTYVEQENKNEQLRQETLERWKKVEQGKVVDHEKVSKWLDSWGTDKEEAYKLINNKHYFILNNEQWNEFCNALNTKPNKNKALQKLLNNKGVFDD